MEILPTGLTVSTLPNQAMELLRTLVQPLIDADVAAVMRKYVDAYFRPAANNARKNLGRQDSRTISYQSFMSVLLAWASLEGSSSSAHQPNRKSESSITKT